MDYFSLVVDIEDWGFLQPSKTCGKNVLIAKLVTTKGFN